MKTELGFCTLAPSTLSLYFQSILTIRRRFILKHIFEKLAVRMAGLK
jgi:hypothetical protein